MERDWCVFLIGGASGTGKTCISYPLAKMYSVNLIEVDVRRQTMQAAHLAPILKAGL